MFREATEPGEMRKVSDGGWKREEMGEVAQPIEGCARLG